MDKYVFKYFIAYKIDLLELIFAMLWKLHNLWSNQYLIADASDKIPDVEKTAIEFIRAFRRGDLGQVILDILWAAKYIKIFRLLACFCLAASSFLWTTESTLKARLSVQIL